MVKMPKETRISAVDVFCGAAGLSFGLRAAGIHIAAGIDIDPDCRYPFERNIGSYFMLRDVSSLEIDEVSEIFHPDSIRVLAGCAPCQPFSSYTTKRRSIDDRWRLILEFMRLIEGVRPEIVTFENVPRLIHLSLWSRFVDDLAAAGYHVNWSVVDAARYGVPQSRRRVVLLASRFGQIDLPSSLPGPGPTVRSAIAFLPPLRAGDQSNGDAMHCARALTDLNLCRIQASRPAGTWREWPQDMKVACHINGESRYPSVYGRMSWDKASPTITTQFYGFGNGRFGHPEQDRALSLREGASLQSFPIDFDFIEKGRRISFNRLGKLIGNAVPPILAREIGNAIVRHVAQRSR